MKSIELGCSVLVINANRDKSMIGKVMKVTDRAEDKDHFFGGKRAWRLNKPIPNLACEEWLVRIDGGGAESDESLAKKCREVAA